MINNSLRAVLAAEANEDGQADSDKKKVKYIYFWAWIENYYVMSFLNLHLELVVCHWQCASTILNLFRCWLAYAITLVLF